METTESLENPESGVIFGVISFGQNWSYICKISGSWIWTKISLAGNNTAQVIIIVDKN